MKKKILKALKFNHSDYHSILILQCTVNFPMYGEKKKKVTNREEKNTETIHMVYHQKHRLP